MIRVGGDPDHVRASCFQQLFGQLAPLTARIVPAANETNDPDRAPISGLDWRLSVNTRSTAVMLSP